MSGLVVANDGGGDSSFYLVDDEMWAQITGLVDAQTPENRNDTYEAIHWLVLNDPECALPPSFPSLERHGEVRKSWYVQHGVVEKACDVAVLHGILVLP